VSVFDLINALEKALEVQSRRKILNPKKIEIKLPGKKNDIGKSMETIYSKVLSHYSKKTTKKTLTFEDLVSGNSKTDKVFTFIPLLHLDTQRKLDLEQQKHFDTIQIKLIKTK
jgi:chromatin segregation and condensation protein Rec8/ScpA/Scc1 (kleisin family)